MIRTPADSPRREGCPARGHRSRLGGGNRLERRGGRERRASGSRASGPGSPRPRRPRGVSSHPAIVGGADHRAVRASFRTGKGEPAERGRRRLCNQAVQRARARGARGCATAPGALIGQHHGEQHADHHRGPAHRSGAAAGLASRRANPPPRPSSGRFSTPCSPGRVPPRSHTNRFSTQSGDGSSAVRSNTFACTSPTFGERSKWIPRRRRS